MCLRTVCSPIFWILENLRLIAEPALRPGAINRSWPSNWLMKFGMDYFDSWDIPRLARIRSSWISS